MKRYIKYLFSAASLSLLFGLSSCLSDLDVTPIDPNLDLQYSADGLFNKCYANIAMAGNGGANGDCDIDGLDGGTTGFVRQMWNANELTTDEAICGWGDDGLAQFCFNTYDASHPMLNGYFSRLTTGISYCNQYLNVASDYNATMTAEIRLVRALHYYLLMDAFGNVPFALTLTTPERYTRKQIYDWLEKELLEIEPSLSDAKAKKSTDSGYGRVDKAACWILLSRLYLNAEVYTGTAQWAKAAEYAKKVMDSSYKLNTKGVNGWSAYQMLFMGDNGETDAAYEAVFPILQDGLKTTSWGTSMFLMGSTYDGYMHGNPKDPIATNGTGQTWAGNRSRPDLLKKFFPTTPAPAVVCTVMPTRAGDDRAIFDGVGNPNDETATKEKTRTLDNITRGNFYHGYAVAKFTNFKIDGSAGHDATFPDADFFFFRSAEAYLTYAEATARLNGGQTTAEGTAAINAIRARANATTRTTSYALSDIIDEWSREFYFEGRRRTDLIRFGKFGGNSDYTWTWKGGTHAGRNFSSDKNIFAIPESQVKGAITQNPGY